jgi:hypothetical protein
MNKNALISPGGVYRYWLTREWDDSLRRVLWCCLNPSTADADVDDASVRKMVGFSKLFGYGGLVLVNLQAFRSTDPKSVPGGLRGVGPDNDDWIGRLAHEMTVICAWGADKKVVESGRAYEVRKILQVESRGEIYCLGKTRDGHPRHPLYLPYDAKLESFRL